MKSALEHCVAALASRQPWLDLDAFAEESKQLAHVFAAAVAASATEVIEDTSSSLLGKLKTVLSERDDRDTLRHGRRYMSNITIAPHGETSVLPSSRVTCSPRRPVKRPDSVGLERELPVFARRNARPVLDALLAIVEARTRGLG